MKITKPAMFLAGFYIALLVWWLAILVSGITTDKVNFAYAFAYGLIPFFGCAFGLKQAKSWGLFKSAMGKALFYFSLGLLTWGIGEMIWSYYTFIANTEIPYPSWADAAFIISWPLWSVGVFFMTSATGARFALRKWHGRIMIVILPLIAVAISYYLLVMVARQGEFELSGGPIKIFFDIAYPIGDVVILTMSLLMYGLSFQYLGGRYKWPVVILLSGFLFNYFADFGFSYTTTVGSFYNGGWVDLLFTTAMFVMSFGVALFDGRDN